MRKILGVVMIGMLTLGSAAAEAVRVLRFGGNPVDPARAETLLPGECVVKTEGLQGPVTVIALVDGEFRLDTGMVPNGTDVVIGPDGQARYIVVCGNDVIGDWRPLGTSVRCEPEAETDANEVPVQGRPENPPGDPIVEHAVLPVQQQAQLGTEIRYVPVSSPYESFAQRHPVWTGFLIGTGVAVVTAIMCHNEVLGVCGDEDGHGTKKAADPNAPVDDDDDDGGGDDDDNPCSNGDCDDPCLSNNGCDDDDDN